VQQRVNPPPPPRPRIPPAMRESSLPPPLPLFNSSSAITLRLRRTTMEAISMAKALRISPRSGSASTSATGLVTALRPSRPNQRMVKAAGVARAASVARAAGVARAVGVVEVAGAVQRQTSRRPSLQQVRKHHVAVQGALRRPVSLHQNLAPFSLTLTTHKPDGTYPPPRGLRRNRWPKPPMHR
jgi:hypothetical protein